MPTFCELGVLGPGEYRRVLILMVGSCNARSFAECKQEACSSTPFLVHAVTPARHEWWLCASGADARSTRAHGYYPLLHPTDIRLHAHWASTVLELHTSCLCVRGWHTTAAHVLARRQHPRQAHLTVAVVNYTTPYKRQKRGLCSSYLAASKPLLHDSSRTTTTTDAGGGEHSELAHQQPARTSSQQHALASLQALQQDGTPSNPEGSGLGPDDVPSAGIHQQQCVNGVVGSSHQGSDASEGGVERREFEQQQEALLGLGQGALASHGCFSGTLQQA
eukprot:scaffold144904_cov18-Tisochrysis_lutea.AAC.2